MDYKNFVGSEKSSGGNLDLNVALCNVDLDLV